MTASLIVVALLLLCMLSIARFARNDGVFAAAFPARPARVPRPTVVARASRPATALPVTLAGSPAPRLEMLEWIDAPRPLTIDAAHARVRDRYIAARFPGVMSGAGDLSNLPKVIEAARLYLDERKFDRAHEMLELATEVSPREAQLRLAQIEIAFLKRDAPRFTDAARALRDAIPECSEWKEVQRLGRAIVPDEPLFGTTTGNRVNEHYGPWPDMPNWIGASWDLTAEYRAADFHQAMSRTAGNVAARLRTAA